MKKILPILENNVQWVLIGVGVLYLAYMAWTFVINTPVSVTINNEKLGPGEIDREISDKPVATLSTKMAGSRTFQLPKLTWADDFKSSMELAHTKPIELAAKPWIDIPVIPSGGSGGGVPEPGGGIVQPIAQLPTVPPAQMGPLA